MEFNSLLAIIAGETYLDPIVIAYRMVLAAGLGLVIGFERELHGRPAGVKTQIIVSASSCLLMIISLELEAAHHVLSAEGVVRLDPSRIASYAVAGMGFLGAGTILQGRNKIQGLTTAASLWANNAIGLAVGAGFLFHAMVAAIGITLTLLFLAPLERLISKDTYKRVYLDFDSCSEKMDEIEELMNDFQVRVLHMGFECRFDTTVSKYEVAIRLKSNQDWGPIFYALRRMEGLTGLKWTEGYVP